MPEINKTINVAGLSIDIYSGPISITCSGGADSSSLLYLLMKYKTDDTIHVFTSGSHNKARRNIKTAINVVEECINLTGNDNIHHHSSFCDVLQFETAADIALQDYVDTGYTNIMYTGITRNPPKDITDKFKLPTTEEVRNPNLENKEILIRNNTVYTPYINVDKRTIKRIYDEENLMNTLFDTTRSCEYDLTSSYFDIIPDPGMEHCGECWWCQERQWAFGRL